MRHETKPGRTVMSRDEALSADDRGAIERAVAARWPEARIRALTALAGDASARRYARVSLRGRDAPATCVAMLLPAEGALRSEEPTAGGEDTDELPFLSVGRYLERAGLPVPAVHLAAPERGVLLLEDLGDRPLADAALAEPGRARALLRSAVDLLARLAALAAHPDATCIAFRRRYDRGLIDRELEIASAYGLAARDAAGPRDAAADPACSRALARLGEAVAAQPIVLMHRDYHAWNLQLDPRGRLRLIDFQDATLGPALHDLASLCTDRDSHRFVPPALEAELVPLFGKTLAARGGPHFEPEALERAYFEAVAFRALRVVGRFRFLAMERGKPAYLRYLPALGAQVRRALERLDRREILAVLESRSEVFR